MGFQRYKRELKAKERERKLKTPKISTTMQDGTLPGHVKIRMVITCEVERDKVNDFLAKYGANPIEVDASE